MSDLSKLCADHLRTTYTSQTSSKLKASHARELVAAFFGYKSHAALIAEKSYPLNKLEEAAIFVPDIPLIEHRRSCLLGLPEDFPESRRLAQILSTFLQEEEYFGGNVWLYDSLETYVMEELLIENDDVISNSIAGAMAETNAEFTEFPYYEDAKIEDMGEALEISVFGRFQGTTIDKPFCGDTIDMDVKVTLPRIAGKRGFLDFDIDVGEAVNDDWVDSELQKEISYTVESQLANELGVTNSELELLEWETQEIASNDGLIYGYILTFYENCPPEVLKKIKGLSKELTVRVSVNAFQ